MKTLVFGISAFLISFGLLTMAGCGSGGGTDTGGGSGNDTGGGSAQTFNMADFFPLTSGWETDRWTLLVDVVQHEINGIMTKAMVDTRVPYVLYWTNDDNGLRLHGYMGDDGILWVFDEPIFFADGICEIGDSKNGTFTKREDGVEKEYSYLISFVAIEDVSVPAGTIADCLKFEILIYPSDEEPGEYGYETVWLAKNIGFVKAQSEANADSDIFTEPGTTRQLLSYHITDPAGLSPDEQAVKGAYITLNDFFSDEDLTGILKLTSDDYLDDQCRNKAALEEDWNELFTDNSSFLFFMTVESIDVDGSDAYVFREGLLSYMPNAAEKRIWRWSRLTRRFQLENGEWMFYGAHLGFQPLWVDVWVRNNAGNEHLAIDAELIDCASDEYVAQDDVSSLTVSGPPGTNVEPDLWQDYKADWGGFFRQEDLANAVNGFYTFTIVEPDGDYIIYTDYLETTAPMAPAALVTPAEDDIVPPGDVILDWDLVADAKSYRVDMQSCDGYSWIAMDNVYPDPPGESSVTVSLDQCTCYRWSVRAQQMDIFDNMDNESRTEWREFKTGAE